MPSHVALSVERLNVQLNTGISLPELPDILNRTVLSGGKKLRPALCFLIGDIFGISDVELAPYARVAELLHCATLAHDDVIDGAALRRRRPTLNSATSNSRAVLAGDLLLARVITELSDLGNLEILRDLSVALEELVNGEWLQMGARGDIAVTREHLEKVALLKTASLMRWCCLVPAHLAGADPEIKAACRRLGESTGLAFQMKDDLLDFKPHAEKSYAQDLRDGLVNFLTRELLDSHPELAGAVAAMLTEGASQGGPLAPPAPSHGIGERAWPWSQAQLAGAGERLAARVFEQLAIARESLRAIGLSLPASRQPAVQALETVLQFVGYRDV